MQTKCIVSYLIFIKLLLCKFITSWYSLLTNPTTRKTTTDSRIGYKYTIEKLYFLKLKHHLKYKTFLHIYKFNIQDWLLYWIIYLSVYISISAQVSIYFIFRIEWYIGLSIYLCMFDPSSSTWTNSTHNYKTIYSSTGLFIFIVM